MPDVYVDSFVMTVQKNKVEDYQKFGERMAAPAKEHGALEYHECVRDDLNVKVIKDPRMNDMCDAKSMPFDMKRMSFGGFSVLVSV